MYIPDFSDADDVLVLDVVVAVADAVTNVAAAVVVSVVGRIDLLAVVVDEDLAVYHPTVHVPVRHMNGFNCFATLIWFTLCLMVFVCTECFICHSKSVMHLLKHMFHVYLSRCSTYFRKYTIHPV